MWTENPLSDVGRGLSTLLDLRGAGEGLQDAQRALLALQGVADELCPGRAAREPDLACLMIPEVLSHRNMRYEHV
jgi:hypothetical protein